MKDLLVEPKQMPLNSLEVSPMSQDDESLTPVDAKEQAYQRGKDVLKKLQSWLGLSSEIKPVKVPSTKKHMGLAFLEANYKGLPLVIGTEEENGQMLVHFSTVEKDDLSADLFIIKWGKDKPKAGIETMLDFAIEYKGKNAEDGGPLTLERIEKLMELESQ